MKTLDENKRRWIKAEVKFLTFYKSKTIKKVKKTRNFYGCVRGCYEFPKNEIAAKGNSGEKVSTLCLEKFAASGNVGGLFAPYQMRKRLILLSVCKEANT